MRRGVIVEPGAPSESRTPSCPGLLAADGDVGADLEVGPAQLVFGPIRSLLHPEPDAVDAHDLGPARSRVRPAASRKPPEGRLVASYQIVFLAGCPGRQRPSPDAWCHRPPLAAVRTGGMSGLGMPVAESAGDRLPCAGIGGLVPGQGAGSVHQSVHVRAVGLRPAAGRRAMTDRVVGLHIAGRLGDTPPVGLRASATPTGASTSTNLRVPRTA